MVQNSIDQAITPLTDLADRISANGANLQDILSETADRFARESEALKQSLRNELGTLVANLENSNGSLHSTLSTIGSTMAEIEGALSEQMARFETTVAQAGTSTSETGRMLTSQTEELRRLTGSALRDLQSLYGQVNDHTNGLVSATERFEVANQSVEATLSEHRATIEEITSALASKTETVDGLMKSFLGRVERSISTAETRAQETSDLIERTVEQASQTLADQLASLSSVASDQGNRAREAVREAQGVMSEEMTRTLRDIASRFTSATEDMRAAAEQMKRDLEITRAEVKRGVLELPDEAAENSAAMRRAVTDQIDALKELANIVSVHTEQPQAARQAPRREARAEPAVRDRTPQAPLDTAVMERAPAEAEPEHPAPQRGTGGGGRRDGQPAMRLPDPEEGTGEADGWVASLLRRASVDEDDDRGPRGRQPTHEAPSPAAESLDVLTNDMARAVDEDSYRDAWSRYNRGESKVFSRRLYTMEGQQTFDEIRRKYQRDRDFRDAVDRYVDDFEQLISDVAETDRTGSTSRTYLTSETGKLYTMLAHASGRLA